MGKRSLKKGALKKTLSLLLAMLIALAFLPSVNTVVVANAAASATSAASNAAVDELLAAISSGYVNTSADWDAMDMAAYGMAGSVAGADIIRRARETFKSGSMTDVARTIIVLTSLGVDACHVYSGSEGVYLDFVAKLGAGTVSLNIEAMFALMALDSGEYGDIGYTANRRACIDALLASMLTPAAGQAAWSMSGAAPNTDTTAMAITALSPYYTGDAAVKRAVDGALAYLSATQNANGHYGNSNSTSMAIIALASMGLDANAASGAFVKNGRSLIDGLLAFRTAGNKFGANSGTAPNDMSTEQGFRALVAYKNYSAKPNTAYNIYAFGRQAGDGTSLTGERDPGAGPPDPGAAKNVSVRLENLVAGTTLIPHTVLKLSGTQLDAVKSALSAHGKDPEADMVYDQTYGYVASICGLGGTDMDTGWMYAVNGTMPFESLGESQVAEGDDIVMFFMNWYDTVYLARFDKKYANIDKGGSVELTLTGVDTLSIFSGGAEYDPIGGATIFALDASGARTGVSAVTDIDGKATLAFPDTGVYTVAAERGGAVNANDLISPVCAVSVSAPGNPPGGGPGGGTPGVLTVYFSLQGMDEASGAEELWINSKALNNVADGATVSDVIISALESTGYTQSGASGGYIRSVTTPGGFTLSEMHADMPFSGWLYKVNGSLHEIGMDAYKVKNGDHILLYFTKNYTKDPDAGRVTGSDSGTGATGGQGQENPEVKNASPGQPSATATIKVTGKAVNGLFYAFVFIEDINAAMNKLGDKAKGGGDDSAPQEIVVSVVAPSASAKVAVAVDVPGVKQISEMKNTTLTLKCNFGAVSFDSNALADATKSAKDNYYLYFIFNKSGAYTDPDTGKKVAGSAMYTLDIQSSDTSLQLRTGTAKVSIPASSKNAAETGVYDVYAVGDDGSLELVENVAYYPNRKAFEFTVERLGTFVLLPVEQAEPAKRESSFFDVSADEWYFDGVQYAYESGFMFGMGNGLFKPGEYMSRAMVATILYRFFGEPDVESLDMFFDVEDGQWYTDAVAWAYRRGVSVGYGDGIYGVDDEISREQLIVMLYNYVAAGAADGMNAADDVDAADAAGAADGSGAADGTIGIFNSDEDADDVDLSEFYDADEISDWALHAIKWAISQGLLMGEGGEDSPLFPANAVTRAEAAAIFMRFIGVG